MFKVPTLSSPVSLLFGDSVSTTHFYTAEGQGKTASGDFREDVYARRPTGDSQQRHKTNIKLL
jgi:hypothetical protein